MSTYRVPQCGRHFVKFDDVTRYPVLVVARTDLVDIKESLHRIVKLFISDELNMTSHVRN